MLSGGSTLYDTRLYAARKAIYRTKIPTRLCRPLLGFCNTQCRGICSRARDREGKEGGKLMMPPSVGRSVSRRPEWPAAAERKEEEENGQQANWTERMGREIDRRLNKQREIPRGETNFTSQICYIQTGLIEREAEADGKQRLNSLKNCVNWYLRTYVYSSV